MFMALSLFNRVILILIAIAVVAGGWFLYYRERNNFDEYRTATIAAAKAQKDKTDLIVKQQQKISKKAEETYVKNIASISAVYNGLRQSNGGGSMPKAPDPTADPIGATSYYVSVAPDLAERCAKTTSQLTSLQDWVKDQGSINE